MGSEDYEEREPPEVHYGQFFLVWLKVFLLLFTSVVVVLGSYYLIINCYEKVIPILTFGEQLPKTCTRLRDGGRVSAASKTIIAKPDFRMCDLRSFVDTSGYMGLGGL